VIYFPLHHLTEAITYGFEKYGNRAIEFDVQLSADDIPILLHDPKLGRTVRYPGYIVDYTASQLIAMDAGAWHSVPFTGATVPLYEDVVAYCRANRIWMNVEVKGDFSNLKHMRHIGATVSGLTKSLFKEELSQVPISYHDLPLISSFSQDALEGALLAAPEIPRALLVRGIGLTEGFIPDMNELLRILERVEASACHMNQKDLTLSQVETLLAEGYNVMCYTVNCPIRLLELEQYGVQSICTDMFDLDDESNMSTLLVSKL
jgi:glycerophosphoryl diester phosphodiesterase